MWTDAIFPTHDDDDDDDVGNGCHRDGWTPSDVMVMIMAALPWKQWSLPSWLYLPGDVIDDDDDDDDDVAKSVDW